MKHPLFFRSGIQLFAVMSTAIKGEFPAVVISCQGDVYYTSADNAVRLEIAPGAVVKTSGTLQLGDGAVAVVYCNGRMKSIQGHGVYALPDLFKPGGLATLNFDPDFGKYVRAAVELAAAKQLGDGWTSGVTEPKQAGDGWGTAVTDPKQAGDGWGTAVTDPRQAGDGWGTAVTDPKQAGDGWGNAVTEPKQAGDGWGGKNADIVLILPFGKLQPDMARFSWSEPKASAACQLEILDQNNEVLYSVTTSESAVQIDLGELNLAPNQIYTWKVRLPEAGGAASGALQFTLLSAEEQAAAAQKASKSSVYPTGDPVLCGIMEAVALEKAGWYAAADEQYAALLEQHPNNNMLRMMYAAFWMRYRMEQQAKAVLKG